MMPLARPGLAIPPAVRRLAQLATLDDEAAAALGEATNRTRTVEARREILTEGRPIPEPLLIADGWAARVRVLDDGRRQFISFLLPGDLIGMCRQRHPLASSTVVALTSMAVCPAPAAGPRPALAQAYAVSLALDEAYLLAQITRLGRLNAQERVGDLLLEFHERLTLAGLVSHNRFDVPLTQEMVADALGLTSVHVNRMLQQARRDGSIGWERGRVTLTDPDRLRQRSGRVSPSVTATRTPGAA